MADAGTSELAYDKAEHYAAEERAPEAVIDYISFHLHFCCFAVSSPICPVDAAPLMCAGLIGDRILHMGATRGASGSTDSAPPRTSQPRWCAVKAAGSSLHPPRRRRGTGFCALAGCGVGARLDGAVARATRCGADLRAGRLAHAGALAATKKGGTVVCCGIHMSDIPSFPYRISWEEWVLRSVANLTRRHAAEFLELAPEAGVRAETVTYPLDRATDALGDLRNGALQGAAVRVP